MDGYDNNLESVQITDGLKQVDIDEDELNWWRELLIHHGFEVNY